MKLHNVFTKKKIPKKRALPEMKVVIDYREKNSLIPSQLKKLGFEIEFKELKVADYFVRDVAIERKTVSDFISSMINKRLIRQLEELQQFKNKLLIIEGIDEQELYPENNGVNPNAVRGFLLSILIKYKIPILFTKNSEDTAKFITRIALKKDQEISTRATKKILNKKEQLQFIIEGFPGIGPVTAKKLLKKFKSIKNIINASEDELKESLGKKGELVKKIIEDKY